MKSYRITDTLKIVRYGNKLRFEINDKFVDGINDDDVAQMINLLIDVTHRKSVNDFAWSKKIGEGESGKKIVMRYTNGLVDELPYSSIDIYLSDDEEHAVRLYCGWLREKFLQILTMLLSRLCEEGV